MNTTYPLWFECFQSTEKIQKASLPAPAACLYPSQWFTPTQLLYLINKRLAIAANFAVLTLERPRQALAGYQLWQQETAPRQHWENSSCKSQKQKRTARARCFQPALFSIWAVCAAVPCQGRGGEGKKRKGRSNKEVDISLVCSRALNTFLLHFNGFLKSIFMQIKACLSHEFTKARPGACLRVGLLESFLLWGGCNLLPFPTGTHCPGPLPCSTSLLQTRWTWLPWLGIIPCITTYAALSPKQTLFPKCHWSGEDQAH